MAPLKRTLVVDFFAAKRKSNSWPMCWSANFDGSLADAKIVAKATIDVKHFPLAERFEILDHEGRLLYEWPEKK
jgi:hypothetical protein